MRKTLAILILLIVVSVPGCSGRPQSSSPASPVGSGPALPPPGNPAVGRKPPMPNAVRVASPPYRVQTWVSGLAVPWDIAFVSQNRAYVTERAGRVRLILNGRLQSKPYARISVVARGEGGLMGIALHPNYSSNHLVYLAYTARGGNRISRFTDTGRGLTKEYVLVRNIASSFVHNGGVIRFGPDGMLYAGTGDGREPERAQDRASLNGKILRMTPSGKVPPDNPFKNSLVYAYGLRNVQGIAWNPANGNLWATMHGPTGEFGLRAKDEVFIVPKGGNCGWPRALGVTEIRGVVPPVLYYPDVSNPPAGAAFYSGNLMPELKGNFFFTSLAGNHLERVVLSGPRSISKIERWFETGEHEGTLGRLRAVVQGPDGALYVSTSNRDGRGPAKPGDDRIVRISPK